MKTRFIPQDRASAGHALLMVLCMTAATLIVLAATMSRTMTTASNNARNNQYVAGLYAAEAATEKVFAMMKSDFLSGNLTAITNHISFYRGAIPNEDPYWNQYRFSDGAGHVNSNYVACTMNAFQLSTNWGPIGAQYAGLCGWINKYRVVSNVKQISGTTYSITNTCQQEIEFDLIPVFQFAIFYNSLLEFTWCAPFTVNGRTHANGSIYTGSIEPLTFNTLVTTTGTISSPAWFGKTTGQYTDKGIYKTGYSTNCQALTLPIGTNNSPDAVREILNMPPAGEPLDSALSQQRFYNKADMVLLVSNSTVMVTLKTSASDPGTNIIAYYYPTNVAASNYVQITTNFPFLNVTNRFTDQRESSDTVLATDIDMGILKSWLVTNAVVNGKFQNTAGVYGLSNVPNILYAADNRTYSGNQLTAVRLKNGAIIPTNLVSIAGNTQPSGFTVATPNPLYVKDNYNCPNNAHLNTTNTTAAYPASLASDALTVLSGNWDDTHSNDLFNQGVRSAKNTTLNAAILTGVVYSTGSTASTFSGGVMNLPRLLEDWGNGNSDVLTLNTSIVNFFNSVRATSPFRAPGGYYYAPKREFSFDLNYLSYNKQPPGTPMLGYVLRAKWVVPPPNTTTYAGD